MSRRAKFGRWGIAEDLTHAQVKFTRDGREQLADVTGMYYLDTRGITMLTLRCFNGELLPDIAASAVMVLERE